MIVIVFVIVLLLAGIYVVRRVLDARFLLQSFDLGNVLVFGMRGRGKDMIFSYVVNRRSSPYVSNVDYTCGDGHSPLDYSLLDINNNRSDFVSGTIHKYVYPYADNTDVYISDCGVYFPSWDTNKLNKEYPWVPLFNALSRHLGNCNVHCNIQNLNRLWITFREQSDMYIMARGCHVFFHKFVYVKYRYYDRYDSALCGVAPFAYSGGLRSEKRMRVAEFRARYGEIRNGSFWFVLKHKYDDRLFKKMLENGV